MSDKKKLNEVMPVLEAREESAVMMRLKKYSVGLSWSPARLEVEAVDESHAWSKYCQLQGIINSDAPVVEVIEEVV